MIDLAQLEAAAKRPGDTAVVTRRFLQQVADEIREGRECLKNRGRVFGLKPGETL